MKPAQALTRLIQGGLLVLVALMPFHAFFSVWLGYLTGHQAIIQAWKEGLLLVLAAAGLVLIAQQPAIRSRLRSWPLLLTGAFAALSLLVTLVTRPSLTAVAFGLKTDLEFFVAFGLAVLVSTPPFQRRLIITIIASAIGVVAFGLAQIYLLSPDFLTRFGYGPGTVPPYLVLDPAVSSLRFGSTLGGPNQLGTYLMLPLALAAAVAIRRHRWWLLALVAGGGIVIFHTYSRSAWIGVIAAAIAITLILTPRRARLSVLGVMIGCSAIAGVILARLLHLGGNLQYYLLHSSTTWHGARGSDYEHLNSLREGLSYAVGQPLGHGLGTAGPATFHTGAGLIIENNYLQIAYETGLIGAGLFIAIIGVTIQQLWRPAATNELAAASLAAIIGISVTALVLPAWTDSTTALVVWTAAGCVVGGGAFGATKATRERHV